MSTLYTVLIPPTRDFAAVAVRSARQFLAGTQLQEATVQPCIVVPMAAQIAGLRRAWVEALHDAPELLPRFLTPGHWLLDLPPQGPSSRAAVNRLLAVQQTLRDQAWLRENLGATSESGLWGLAQTLISLCDELSETWLPTGVFEDDNASARMQTRLDEALEKVYAHLHRRVLGDEAQLVLTFWRLLTTRDDPIPARLRDYERLAARADVPMVWVAPFEPSPLERCFIDALARRVPLCLIRQAWPGDTDADLELEEPVAQLLRAWPECRESGNGASVPWASIKLPFETVNGLEQNEAAEPPRLRIVAAQRFEDEAIAAAGQLLEWLNQGHLQLALVAQDRIVARRVRALLARAGIPVRDETGWKLSTTRAAAAVMRWFDVIAPAAGPEARVLLDWLKSPFVLADRPRHVAQTARLERGLQRYSASGGWRALRQAAQYADQHDVLWQAQLAVQSSEQGRSDHTQADEEGEHGEALDELAAAAGTDGRLPPVNVRGPMQKLMGRLFWHAQRWGRMRQTLLEWNTLLDQMAEAFGLRRLLAQDEAGRQVLHALAQLRGNAAAQLSLSEYRALLVHLFESSGFREEPPPGEVRVTILPLAGTRMRRFDGVVMVGCDDSRLPALPQDTLFFSDRLRRELGLPDRAARLAQQARDFAELLIGHARAVCTWQKVGARGEALRLAGWLLRLQEQSALIVDCSVARNASQCVVATPLAQPAVSATALVPTRLSANAYNRLRNCPYQFFATRMLGLSDSAILDVELSKRDIGEWLHEILDDYHRRSVEIGLLSRDARVALLSEVSNARFAAAIAEDGHAIPYWKRWQRRIEAYVDWQLRCEAEGWRWVDGEVAIECNVPLGDGTSIVLHGRLDRIDADSTGREAIRDYKFKSDKTVKELLKQDGEDCQLPFYLLLRDLASGSVEAGGTPRIAGYIGLDSDNIAFHALPDADVQRTQLLAALCGDMTRLRRGAALRALGDARACGWCEARGLCRKGHWHDSERQSEQEPDRVGSNLRGENR